MGVKSFENNDLLYLDSFNIWQFFKFTCFVNVKYTVYELTYDFEIGFLYYLL